MWVICNSENDEEEDDDDADDDDDGDEEEEDDGWMDGWMDGWIILPEGGTVTKTIIHIYANQNMDRTNQALRA